MLTTSQSRQRHDRAEWSQKCGSRALKKLLVQEAKTRLSGLLAEVETGEQFVITRRGLALARLVAVTPDAARRAQGNAQRQRVNQAFAERAQLPGCTVLDVPPQAAIGQGRLRCPSSSTTPRFRAANLKVRTGRRPKPSSTHGGHGGGRAEECSPSQWSGMGEGCLIERPGADGYSLRAQIADAVGTSDSRSCASNKCNLVAILKGEF